jgi:putative heme-binding domain-containing protein
VYIADFYNRIIGHYEVPLKHPGRDRERGRIWRVVYRGTAGDATKPQSGPTMPNLTDDKGFQPLQRLGDRNLAVRTLATNLLVESIGPVSEGRQVWPQLLSTPPSGVADPAAWRAHYLWVLARLDLLDEAHARQLAEDPEAIVRVHLTQALAVRPDWVAQPDWPAWKFEIARSKLNDANAFVRRAAATALAQHPSADNVRPLARALMAASADDPQLVHATKIALRDQLRSPLVGEALAGLELAPDERRQVLAIAALSPSGPAAALVCQAALEGTIGPDMLVRAAPQAARFMAPDRIDALVNDAVAKYADHRSFQFALLQGLGEGLASRGQRPTDRMRHRMTDLLAPDLDSGAAPAWINYPAPEAAPSANPWVFEPREYADGATQPLLVSSLREHNVAGERLTGVLRSREFALPAKLSFWMCGHDGRLKKAKNARENRNYVRLLLADGTEVARSKAPQRDVAQRFEWNLSEHQGQTGYIELVDGLSADAFAWLAAARFEPPVIPEPTAPIGDRVGRQAQACRLAAEWRLESLAEPMARLSLDGQADAAARLAAGEALLSVAPERATAPLNAMMIDGARPVATRQKAAELLGRANRDDARAALAGHLIAAPRPLAASIAAALAGHKESAAALMDLIRAGKASATLLREPTVVDRLRASGIADLDAAITELTAKLSPADDRIAELVNQRRQRYLNGQIDPQTGRSVFARSVCKNCHKIGEVGSAIAPALDGIGVRGLDRLLEDLLDPNRNVDQAFRVTTIETDDGLALAGFGLHEDGQSLTLFDAAGQTRRVPLASVAARHVSSLSPMPANVAETMSEEDFCQLLGYLLSLKTK